MKFRLKQILTVEVVDIEASAPEEAAEIWAEDHLDPDSEMTTLLVQGPSGLVQRVTVAREDGPTYRAWTW